MLTCARPLSLNIMLLLYRLRNFKEMKKMYIFEDAQALNHCGSSSGHQSTMNFFGQIQMCMQTAHQLREE
jgi:hypothetical protein